jgi:hypothetical protein
MSQWFDRLHFLWEEEVAPPVAASEMSREAAAGVPRPLRRATRFALIGVVSISVMAQVVGVRLVAPVDADTRYSQQCIMNCKTARTSCLNGCAAGGAGANCRAACSAAYDRCTNGCGK